MNAIMNNNLALLEDYTLLLVVIFTLRNPLSSLFSPPGQLAQGLKSFAPKLDQKKKKEKENKVKKHLPFRKLLIAQN